MSAEGKEEKIGSVGADSRTARAGKWIPVNLNEFTEDCVPAKTSRRSKTLEVGSIVMLMQVDSFIYQPNLCASKRLLKNKIRTFMWFSLQLKQSALSRFFFFFYNGKNVSEAVCLL